MSNFKNIKQSTEWDAIQQNTNIIIRLSPEFEKLLAAKQKHQKGKHCTVDPIKSLEDIELIKNYFLNRDGNERYDNLNINIRDYMLFVIGINCARRISDLVQFKIGTFINSDGTFKDYIDVNEKKTGKYIKIKINQAIKEVIGLYLATLASYNLDNYIFKSRKGDNAHINEETCHKIMKKMSRDLDLDKKYNIGTHSLRKTWAYHYYINNPLELIKIQKALNHSSPSITLRYIGIDQEEMDAMFDNNVL